MVNAASYAPNPGFAPEKRAPRSFGYAAKGGVPPSPPVYENNGVAQATACRSLSYKVYSQSLEPQGLTQDLR
jgi:hypothetical protein